MLPITVLILALAVPPLTGRIVDQADLLTAQEEQTLSAKLLRIEQSTTLQITVLTIESLEGTPIEDFGIDVAEEWKIGQKRIDNGAIFIIAAQDRKIRIEIGYGLEPVIPDGLAGSIIRDELAPHFRDNRYYEGLDAGIDAVVKAAAKEYPEKDRQPGAGGRISNELIILIIFIILILIFTSGRGSGRSRRWRRSTWTSPGPWHFPSGGGGGWSGGGGGGGGFSGGGGSFGGGGASGGW